MIIGQKKGTESVAITGFILENYINHKYLKENPEIKVHPIFDAKSK